MATTSPALPRLASSVRLVLAMFRLYADIETGFGQAVLALLKKSFPDQKIDISPATVGHKLMAIARKQNQNDDSRAMDSIQDFLTYISTGSKYETDSNGKILKDKDGVAIPRKTPKTWDFSRDFKTWQEALDAIYSNVRRRSMDKSIKNQKLRKTEKSVDDAFGKRGEGGGAPEGGEGHMPTEAPSGGDMSKANLGELGRALDDKAAIREFYDLLDMHIGDLKSSLSPETRALFDLIFEDEVGGFGSDIKDNMGQASALKEKHPELYEKNAKRWSGFVGDLRKKLLTEIWKYIDDEMSDRDYQRLKEAFFSETTPKDVSDIKKKEQSGKEDYQRGIDERKLARFKWQEKEGTLSEADKKSYDNLSKKLKGQGVDVDKIEPVKPEEKKTKKGDTGGVTSQASSIARRLASRNWF